MKVEKDACVDNLSDCESQSSDSIEDLVKSNLDSDDSDDIVICRLLESFTMQ